MRIAYLLMMALLLQWLHLNAQELPALKRGWLDSTGRALSQFPEKYFSQVSGKSRHFEKQVNKRSQKALERLARQEKKMQARLAKIDSVAAKNIFSRSIDSMGNLQARLKKKRANMILPSWALATPVTWILCRIPYPFSKTLNHWADNPKPCRIK